MTLTISFVEHSGQLLNTLIEVLLILIVGGESGHKARPIRKEWVIDIKSQCDESNVPFFSKQWGRLEFNTNPEDPTIDSKHVNHANGGCLLDGQIYRELPEKYRRAS